MVKITGRKSKGDGDGRMASGEMGEEMIVMEEGAVFDRAADEGNAPAAAVGAAAKKDRFLPISILIAAALIGGALVFTSFYHGSSAGSPAGAGAAPGGATPTTGPSAPTTASIMALGPRDAILGNASALVTLIEYGDYQCPFCARFFSETQPQITSNYINAGKVRMVFRNFPFLGPESTAAAEAADCANDQGKFWPYHEALYQAKVDDENKGGGENDGYFTRALFLSLAQNVGLNIATFTGCIDNNTDANLVTQEKAAATAAGVNATPTFFVNGTQVLGAQPYSAFQSAIDAALGSAH